MIAGFPSRLKLIIFVERLQSFIKLSFLTISIVRLHLWVGMSYNLSIIFKNDFICH